MSGASKTRLVKPKTKKGERVLKDREPQLVETVKKILLLYGAKPSQTVKDILTDIHKLEPSETVRLTRKNAEVLPFEAGGEVKLEQFSAQTDCGQFVLATHTKKRPHNLILGRFYDNRLYDLLELGVEGYKSITSFGAAASKVQLNNKPCFVFAGEQFQHDPDFKQAKSVLLDLFRGQVVEGFNLTGLDHVIFVTAQDRKIFFRQYTIRFKKSGNKIPRVELAEMGPSIDFALRRIRPADSHVEKEAHKHPKITKRKEKNVGSDLLEGKIGRIYLPNQMIDTMPQHKMKGLKRDHQAEKTEAGKKLEAEAAQKKSKVVGEDE